MKIRFHFDHDGSGEIVEHETPVTETPVIPRLAEYIVVGGRGPMVVTKLIWSESGSIVDIFV